MRMWDLRLEEISSVPDLTQEDDRIRTKLLSNELRNPER